LGAIEEELRINLLGPIKLTKRLLPHLVAGRGGIVNMLSLLAVMPKSNAPGYCASKAGLHAFSKSMEALLASTGVRVFVAFPPLVDTPMTRGRGSNKMSAAHFVAAMLEQMAEGRSEIRVGQAKTLLALNRVAPAVALWWTRRISAGRTLSDASR
ncbi:MAG TPA: SDR family NAD(P)-dependent oxidoreductase, partial [Burkholderiales bacterium]|nr:SDR family NAD(P)-dependent oxidoreductase [Burkholderiales bacterium]